jgi:hypothetical protein
VVRDLFGEVPEQPKKRRKNPPPPPPPIIKRVNLPGVRRTDPENAHDAAAKAGKHITKVDSRIISFLDPLVSGITTLEFSEQTGLKHNNISSRFTQLEKAGYLWRNFLGISDKGHPIYESRKGSTGASSNVWRAARYKPLEVACPHGKPNT